MSFFDIEFVKRLADSTGHERDVSQSAIHLQASNAAEAIKKAERLFCAKRGILHWSLHADFIKLKGQELETSCWPVKHRKPRAHVQALHS